MAHAKMMTFSRSLEDLHKWHCVWKSINHIDISMFCWHICKPIYSAVFLHTFQPFPLVQFSFMKFSLPICFSLLWPDDWFGGRVFVFGYVYVFGVGLNVKTYHWWIVTQIRISVDSPFVHFFEDRNWFTIFDANFGDYWLLFRLKNCARAFFSFFICLNVCVNVRCEWCAIIWIFRRKKK